MNAPRLFSLPSTAMGLAVLAVTACTEPRDEPVEPVDQPTDETATDTGDIEPSSGDTGSEPAPNVVSVVLLAGQSNMAGRANGSELPAVFRVPQPDVQLFYSGGGSLPADTLVPLEGGSGTTVGPEVTLGHTLADLEPDTSFVLIKHAVGGTNLFDDWDPNTGTEYETFSDTVALGLQALTDRGLTPEIRGVAWLQGEADANQGRSESEYAADLTEFIQAVRTDFAPDRDLRFVIGRLSDRQFEGNVNLSESREAIQAAQDDVAATVANVGLLDTDALTLSDDRHYDAVSQQALGVLFARSLLESGQLSTTAQFDFGITGESASAEEPGWTPVQLQFTGDNGSVRAVDPATGWTVDLESNGADLLGRNRSALDADVDDAFTLEAVYIDFIVGWETLTIGHLDPSRRYDVTVRMFDDNGRSGRTQTLTHETPDSPVELGTTDGPGTNFSGQLTDDLVYSIVGTALAPDASGTLTFRCSNSATVDRCLSNGVVISEN